MGIVAGRLYLSPPVTIADEDPEAVVQALKDVTTLGDFPGSDLSTRMGYNRTELYIRTWLNVYCDVRYLPNLYLVLFPGEVAFESEFLLDDMIFTQR